MIETIWDKGDDDLNKRLKRFGLIAMCIAALSIVSAIPASADVSRVEYFSIQSNTICGDISPTAQYKCEFKLNINNISGVPVELTLFLYKKDGTLLTSVGVNTSVGVSSDIIPGIPIAIGGNQTISYYQFFGYGGPTSPAGLSCNERPAYGKIEVHSNGGLLLASGDVQAFRFLPTASQAHWEMYDKSTVVVNGGKTF